MKGSGSSSWSARPRLTVLPRPAPPGVDILHVQGWILDFYPCPAPAARHYFPIICSHPTWSPTNPNTFSFLCPPQHWKAHTCSFEGVENSFLSHPGSPAVRPYPHIPSQPGLFVTHLSRHMVRGYYLITRFLSPSIPRYLKYFIIQTGFCPINHNT